MQHTEGSMTCTRCLLSAKHCSQCFTCTAHLTERRPSCWDPWTPTNCGVEIVGWQNAEIIWANTALNNGQEEPWPLGLFQWFHSFCPPSCPYPLTILAFFYILANTFMSPLLPCRLHLDKPSFIPISFLGKWHHSLSFWVRLSLGPRYGTGKKPIDRCRMGALQNVVWLLWWHVGKMITSLCLKRNLCMSPPIMQTGLLEWDQAEAQPIKVGVSICSVISFKVPVPAGRKKSILHSLHHQFFFLLNENAFIPSLVPSTTEDVFSPHVTIFTLILLCQLNSCKELCVGQCCI